MRQLRFVTMVLAVLGMLVGAGDAYAEFHSLLSPEP
jgi:hypothetical protein